MISLLSFIYERGVKIFWNIWYATWSNPWALLPLFWKGFSQIVEWVCGIQRCSVLRTGLYTDHHVYEVLLGHSGTGKGFSQTVATKSDAYNCLQWLCMLVLPFTGIKGPKPWKKVQTILPLHQLLTIGSKEVCFTPPQLTLVIVLSEHMLACSLAMEIHYLKLTTNRLMLLSKATL